MTAPTDYYLDCTVDSNGGSGTNGDPWTFTDASGDKIYQAIGNITRDTTNGDRLNVQGQDDTTKAIAPAAAGYGSFASNSIPLIIEGWGGGSQGDGGIFTVDGGGGSFHGFDLWTGNDYPFILVRGKIGNFSTGTPYTCLTTQFYAEVIDCELHDCYDGIYCSGGGLQVRGTYFHDLDHYGINNPSGSGGFYTDNYFENGSTLKFDTAIWAIINTPVISRNGFSLDGASDGIRAYTYDSQIKCNTIHGGGSGTGTGLQWSTTSGRQPRIVAHNIFTGFGGTGGIGFDGKSTTAPYSYYGNAFYDNASNTSNLGDSIVDIDNEALSGTPYDESGSLTYANRATYFAAADEGNVRTGGPHGQHKGAFAAAAGGGGDTIVLAQQRERRQATVFFPRRIQPIVSVSGGGGATEYVPIVTAKRAYRTSVVRRPGQVVTVSSASATQYVPIPSRRTVRQRQTVTMRRSQSIVTPTETAYVPVVRTRRVNRTSTIRRPGQLIPSVTITPGAATVVPVPRRPRRHVQPYPVRRRGLSHQHTLNLNQTVILKSHRKVR